MKWFFMALSVILLFSWGLRWSEVEPQKLIEGHAIVSYKVDHWTGQGWAVYDPPAGVYVEGINLPLIPPDKRFSSNEEIGKELEKRAISGQLVEAWRKRDLATYIWINITTISMISSLIGFWHSKKERDFRHKLNERD